MQVESDLEKTASDNRSPQELLQEFVKTGRQEPFEEIVRRYAGMVFHVCRQVVKNTHDAEDVTQAVFLTLATQSRTTQIKYIGPWLQQVAYRLALDVRKSHKRRELREIKHFELSRHNGNGNGRNHAPPASDALDQSELRGLLADELNKLPLKYRMPLVLHYFGGMSRDEMASELRCKPSTLGVRLFRGRAMLSQRLAERGIVVGSGVVAVILSSVVRDAVSEHLLASVCHYATVIAAGQNVSAVVIPQGILQLAQAASRALLATRLKTAAAATILGIATLAAGAQVITHYDLSEIIPQLFRLNFRELFHFKTPLPRLDVPVPRITQDQPAPFQERPGTASVATVDEILKDIVVQPVGTVDPLSPSGQVFSGSFRIGPSISPALGDLLSRPAPAPVQSPVLMPQAPPAPPPTVMLSSSAGTWPTNPVSTPASAATHNDPGKAPAPPAAPDSGSFTLTPDPAASYSSVGSRPAKNLALDPVAASGRSPQTDHTAPAVAARNPPLVFSADVLTDESFLTQADLSTLPLALVQSQLAACQNALAATAVDPAVTTGDTTARRSATGAAPPPAATGVTSTYPGYQTRTWSSDAHSLEGWGAVDVTGTLDNSGVVVADGSGSDRTLSLTKASLITNSIDNPPDGIAGWYAIDGGKLSLPAVHLLPGARGLTWGESATDPVLDLVNSVRLTFDSISGGDVFLSLLSPDRTDIPAGAPGGLLDVWSIDAGPVNLSNLSATIRLDSLAIADLGASDAGVELWRYSDGTWAQVPPDQITFDLDNHLLSGKLGKATSFAVSAHPPISLFGRSVVTPEPGTLALGAFAAAFLLRRRRRADHPAA